MPICYFRMLVNKTVLVCLFVFCCCLQFCLLVHHQLLAVFKHTACTRTKVGSRAININLWVPGDQKKKKRRKCIGATLLAAGWFRVRMGGHRAAVWGAIMSAWLNSNGLRTDGRLKVCASRRRSSRRRRRLHAAAGKRLMCAAAATGSAGREDKWAAVC